MILRKLPPPNLLLRRCLLLLVAGALLFPNPGHAQGLSFSTLDELWAYADAHSAVAQTASAQMELARLQNAAAVANTVNLRGTASITATNNFALPVNFLPAEIFGGPAGTFRTVTFGQQFVNVASIAPQLDLVNPSTWARISSAHTSMDLTETTNALNRRNLHENIATAYSNFGSVVDQLEWAEMNLLAADTIVDMVFSRYSGGIARLQDLNSAKVNRASLADFVQQLQTRKSQHLLTLKNLIGMPAEEMLDRRARLDREVAENPGRASSILLRQQAALQAKLQRSELLANRLAFLPTVSVVAGFNWQQNSNEKQFNSADWIDSRYIGLKLSVPIPTETRLWSQAEDYRINLHIKDITAGQAVLQETFQNQQLDLEIQRATQALTNAETIFTLKSENFLLNNANYREGILTLDQLLLAFTDMTNANLSRINAEWNLQLQLTKLGLYQNPLFD